MIRRPEDGCHDRFQESGPLDRLCRAGNPLLLVRVPLGASLRNCKPRRSDDTNVTSLSRQFVITI